MGYMLVGFKNKCNGNTLPIQSISTVQNNSSSERLMTVQTSKKK